MVKVISNSFVHSCWGSHLGFLGQARGSWSAHGLPWVLLSRLWLSYCALVFVYLMQTLSYILWMKKINQCLPNNIKTNMNCTCNKGIINPWFIFVYVMETFITYIWKAQYKFTSPFSSLHLFFSVNFSYMKGFKFILTHTHHLGFQWKVHPPWHTHTDVCMYGYEVSFIVVSRCDLMNLGLHKVSLIPLESLWWKGVHWCGFMIFGHNLRKIFLFKWVMSKIIMSNRIMDHTWWGHHPRLTQSP